MNRFEDLLDLKVALDAARNQLTAPDPFVEEDDRHREVKLQRIARARSKLPERIAFLEATLAEGMEQFGDDLTTAERAQVGSAV